MDDNDDGHSNLDMWRGEINATVKNTQASVTQLHSDVTAIATQVGTLKESQAREIGELKVATTQQIGKLDGKLGSATTKIGIMVSAGVILAGIISTVLTALLLAKLGLK